MEKTLAKTLAAIIVLSAVFFLHQLPAFAARSTPGRTLYSTSDSYSFTLNAGELFYSGTGPHISAPLYGVKFGYDAPGNSIFDSFATEGSLHQFSSSSSSERGDTTGYLFRIEELLPFTPGERLVPFAAVGAGGIYTKDDTVSKVMPFFNYGVGLKYFLTSTIALRADFRHILALTLEGTDNFETSAGLSYYFGKKDLKKIEPASETKKREDEQKSNGKTHKSDIDRVKEEKLAQEKKEKERIEQEQRDQERRKEEKLRKERLQKEWAEFEARRQEKPAVAAGPKIAPVKKEPIVNATIPPAAIPPVQTSIAIKAEAAAPARENVVIELLINFDFDKADVKKLYQSQIKKVADYLKSDPGFSVIIEGHTDNKGSSEYNLKLSQRRANSVKNDLVRHGVDANRISTEGYGFTRPIASNLTAEGRQKNRRVVAVIIVKNK